MINDSFDPFDYASFDYAQDMQDKLHSGRVLMNDNWGNLEFRIENVEFRRRYFSLHFQVRMYIIMF